MEIFSANKWAASIFRSGTRYAAPLDTSTTLFHYSFIISRYHSFALTLSAIKINYIDAAIGPSTASSAFEGYTSRAHDNANATVILCRKEGEKKVALDRML